MALRIEGLTKAYRQKRVLGEVSFDVDAGELITIIGPSGAGKTTLLKLIAGIEEADAGIVRFNSDTALAKYPPAVLVFQEYILFPHLSVFENIAFGLKARRIEKKEFTRKVEDLLEFFDLSDKSGFFPVHLSSGQKQRVALARALIVEPSILLLDEPFANLDKSLKLSTAEFIRETIKSFNIPCISVTHDQSEAFAMSDRIGILLDGRLVQLGNFDEIYNRPVSFESANFLGRVNKVPASYTRFLSIPEQANEDGEIFFRAEELEVRWAPEGAGLLRRIYPTGETFTRHIEIDGRTLVSSGPKSELNAGDQVDLRVRRTLSL